MIADGDEVIEEAERDEAEQADDRQLEAAVAALLEREDAERDDGVIRPAGNRPIPNSRCSPIAAPTNSARSVAIATISACTHKKKLTVRGKLSRHSSSRLPPDARPAFADRYCTSIAMRFAMTMTQTSR